MNRHPMLLVPAFGIEVYQDRITVCGLKRVKVTDEFLRRVFIDVAEEEDRARRDVDI
jgi:hypothetical protein